MMSGVMEAGMDGGDEGSRCGAPDGRPEGGREVRWSARRKEGVVLRLLRGESLDALARALELKPAGLLDRVIRTPVLVPPQGHRR